VTRAEHELINLRDDQLPHLDRSLVEQTIKQMQEAASGGGSGAAGNMRRENKTYSYKEQMADLELKRELEAKKAAKSGKKDDASDLYSIEKVRAAMSKKQQEQLDNQVQREMKVRDELRLLDANLRRCASILIRVTHGNVLEAKLYLSSIVRALFKLFKSPMCSAHILAILGTFAQLDYCNTHSAVEGNAAPRSESFYLSTLYSALRLALSPPLPAEWKRWCQETLERAHTRTLIRLSVEFTADAAEDNETDLDLSKAAFFYPFLKLCSSHVSHTSIKEPLEVEQAVRGIITSCGTLARARSHVQAQLLASVDHAWQQKSIAADLDLHRMINEQRLRQIVDNFMSSEYAGLLLGLVVRSSEEKLAALSVQYVANETLAALFKFTGRFLFYERPVKQRSTQVDDGLDLDEADEDDMVVVGGAVDLLSVAVCNETSRAAFVEAFNADVAQLVAFMTSSCYYAREACLQSLSVLVNEK
jgi:hypothetical protein